MNSEQGTVAMVSRSRDGEIVIPLLRLSGIIPVRGSSRNAAGGKGGLEALDELEKQVCSGRSGFLAVDGPRGPRGRVHKGIAALSQRTGAAVLNFVAVPRRRWILSRSWDRLQIPKPFSTIDAYFSEPLFPQEGESTEAFRIRIQESLHSLERAHDPVEAEIPLRPRESLSRAA